MQFKNLDSLFKYLEKDVEWATQLLANDVYQIIHTYIQREWYDAHTPDPKIYNRTRDYINSLTVGKVKKVGRFYEVEIYFDTNKIRMQRDDDAFFNQHMSIDGSTSWNGKDINELIPYFIEYGQDSSLHSYEGIAPMSNTWAELEATGKHVNKIMDLLERKGYKVVIGRR